MSPRPSAPIATDVKGSQLPLMQVSRVEVVADVHATWSSGPLQTASSVVADQRKPVRADRETVVAASQDVDLCERVSQTVEAHTGRP
jgi:hypothetical protein